MLAYFLVILYLAVEYLQPGIKSGTLAALRPNLTVGILLFVTSLFYMLTRRKRFVFPRQSKLYLSLIVLMAVSTLTAVVRGDAWLALSGALRTFALYFILTQVVDTGHKLKGLLYVLVAIHVWVAIDGLHAFSSLQGQGGEGRLVGVLAKYLGNSNDFALALVIIIPFAYFLMLYSESWLARAMFAGCIALFAAGTIASLSRGGQIALAVVLVTIGIRSRRKTPVIVVLGSFAILFGLFASQAYWNEVESIANYKSDANAQSRLHAWYAAVEIAARNPLLGVGPGNFKNVYGREYTGSYSPTGSKWLVAHSVYFETLADLGFTGLGIFLALVVTNLRTCARLVRENRAGNLAGPDSDIMVTTALACGVSLVGYLVACVFVVGGPQFYHLTAIIVIADSLAPETSPTYSNDAVVLAARPITGERMVGAR